ncbi:MAG: glycosyltransferase family 2 protein [Candidatus Omnitrophica bacterium]|nr:glycosyltransferase family 2 protein [Candidatus Omnitrophota bacterium]
MEKPKVSCVVITKNESQRIKDCLKSIKGWADEIIVVDDESTDDTVRIAKELADKVIVKKMDNEGRHRNWAYQQSRNLWVLSIDADERLTEELKQEIDSILSKGTTHAGFSIPRKNYIGSYWIRYAGQYPAAQLRLFRKDKFKYEEVEVHPRAFLDGSCGHLKSDIIHYSWRDFEHFADKVNRQTTWEAQKWINTNRKMSTIHAFWRAFDRFFRKFIIKKGYKDGLIGFMVAYFDSYYQILSYAKYRQILFEKNKNNLYGE